MMNMTLAIEDMLGRPLERAAGFGGSPRDCVVLMPPAELPEPVLLRLRLLTGVSGMIPCTSCLCFLR